MNTKDHVEKPDESQSEIPGAVSGTGESGSGAGSDAGAGAGARIGSGLFDHEKLDVYRVAREFFRIVQPLLKRRISRATRDQLERASLSIITNICEGAGKTASDDKKKYYECARGSANECAGVIDTLRLMSVITEEQYQEARSPLLRVSQMLSRMCGAPRFVKKP